MSDTHAAIYVASRSRHAPLWQVFRDRGYPIVSSWIDAPPEHDIEAYSAFWDQILSECRTCTALVLYAPPEDAPYKGALIEVGAVLGRGLPVFVVSADPQRLGTWTYHPGVIVVPDLDEAFRMAVAYPKMEELLRDQASPIGAFVANVARAWDSRESCRADVDAWTREKTASGQPATNNDAPAWNDYMVAGAAFQDAARAFAAGLSTLLREGKISLAKGEPSRVGDADQG